MARLTRLRDLSFGRKLFALSALVTGILLLALTGAAAFKEVRDWRKATVAQLQTAGRIIGANVAPALLFGDPRTASDSLASVSATPNVVYAAVYDQKGDLFAAYGDRRLTPLHISAPTVGSPTEFTKTTLVTVEPVVFQGQRLGTIALRSDLRDIYGELLSDIGLLLIICAASFSAYAIVLLGVQRSVVRPMTLLTEAMERVTRTGDYSARVVPESRDEIGVLAASFNAMLAAVQERDARLAQTQAGLEATVHARTAELQTLNTDLERELKDRREAQDALHAHDAMLKAVARSAEELLGSLSLDDAIAAVLELIGHTLAVGRVQLCAVETDRDGHLHAKLQQEWAAPGVSGLHDDPALADIDITAQVPRLAAASVVGDRTILSLPELPKALRPMFERVGMTSMLVVPVMVEGKLWGGLWFMDSSPEPRDWSWAETDTLATLAGLVGVSTARARYLKELADANTIVQNSPTVLYRLRGDPQMQLTYISHNVTKFGYDPKALIGSNTFLQTVVHPDDQQRLTDAMASMMERNASGATIEFRLMLPSGGFRWVENRYTLVRDEVGRLIEIEGIIIDITERKAAEEKIALLARTDSLTGLANRATFVERLHQAFSAARRGAGKFAVLYLDLDHFKDINDTRGHPTGDLLLKQVAERLRNRVRETDVVARLGGDEFAVIQTEVADPADAGALGADIVSALADPYVINGEALHVTASVGIAPYLGAAPDPDSLLAQADLALYRAKEDGRNQYRFHSEDLDRQVSERVSMASDLRTALKRGELFLEYQPQVELLTGKIVGMEALVRWRHPTRGVLRPAAFLPVAESSGVIDEVGRWVLESACRQLKEWRDQGHAPPVMAVNVSMRQLRSGLEFVQEVADVLKRYGLKPGELELDVTESMLAKVTLAQNDVLDRLARSGVRLALDDFGAEYSTFDYLRAYRVNHLKVAREFVEDATHDAGRAATVRAIIGAARELGIKVIAEGVENDEQRSLLLSIGRATKGQGFYFSEPVSPAAAMELLKKGAITPAEDQAPQTQS